MIEPGIFLLEDNMLTVYNKLELIEIMKYIY